jgi:hypothetical protein
MNLDLLARVRAHIAAGADVDMHEWRCGTAACIGGWAVQLAGYAIADRRRSLADWVSGFRPQVCLLGESRAEVHDAAQTLLGLTDDEAEALFYMSSWPSDLSQRYYAADDNNDTDAMRAAVLERIDRLMGVTLDAVTAAARDAMRPAVSV